MKSIYIISAFLVVFAGCKNPEQKTWQFEKTINLGKATPVGLVVDESAIYYSDSHGNRIVKINEAGKELKSYNGFERPMHIYKEKNNLYVPELGAGIVTKLNLQNGKKEQLKTYNGIETPAAVYVSGTKTAIVDFNYHRIILQTGKNGIVFGEKGHDYNKLYYPTDIAFESDTIFIADAYNHRIQLFDINGEYLKSLAYNDSINTLSGMEITGNQIIAGDYENNRVLIYNRKGEKQQVLKMGFNKPIEISVSKNKMYVANFGDNSITIYKLK